LHHLNSNPDNFLPAIKEHFDINFQLIAEVWTAKVKRAESNFINNITGFSDFIIDNDNFSDNVIDSNIGNDDFITNYIVHKRFLRRNGSPEWGVFHIMKCPEINGERNDYYLCSWEPVNNTEEILTRKILQKMEKMTEEISEMTRTIVRLTETVAKSCEPDEESKWFSYTIKMIQKESKPCPNCNEFISKISGCDQMFCVHCGTAFSWKTGQVERGTIHNPHAHQYFQKNFHQFLGH
jgi:hypothetical protein